jgi:Glycosyl hydrolase catalytic core
MNPRMRRLLPLTLLFALALAAPASARAPIVGIGDQQASMFSSPAFTKLGVGHSRLVLAWDWYRIPYMVHETDLWMQQAQAAGIRPLVALNRNYRSNGHRVLPSMKAYRKSFRLLREKYPWVTDYSAWNEANHVLQPTSKKPYMAARYYNAMRKDCRKCTIVAADVLDTSDMLAWIQKFKRHAPTARIWGLHNYKEANDGTGTTRTLLRAVRGQVWLTETGGIVLLKRPPGSGRKGRRHTKAEQARAVKRVYRIAKSNRRITRVYFYEWAKKKGSRWDSAFVETNGRLRPSYHVLRRGLRVRGGVARAR